MKLYSRGNYDGYCFIKAFLTVNRIPNRLLYKIQREKKRLPRERAFQSDVQSYFRSNCRNYFAPRRINPRVNYFIELTGNVIFFSLRDARLWVRRAYIGYALNTSSVKSAEIFSAPFVINGELAFPDITVAWSAMLCICKCIYTDTHSRTLPHVRRRRPSKRID